MKTLKDKEVGVIIPAYNEAAHILELVNKLISLGAFPIIVNDGSTDGTKEICSKIDDAILINHDVNKGYTEALSSGFDYAQKQNFIFLATLDADAQISAEYIRDFREIAKNNNYDLVVGSRDFKNRYSEILSSIILSKFYGIEDPFCGLKLYRLDSIRQILPFDTLNLIGSEILLKSKKIKLKIYQHKIKVKKRVGLSKFGNSFLGEIKILIALFKILKNFRRD